jgi:ATP-dependent Clp protease adaptor protein ClpS
MSSQNANQEPREDGDVEVVERVRTKQPRRYSVVLHNDDFTPMEFVVVVLMQFFHKSEPESTHLMLQVHHRGWAVVGVFSRDIAETKASHVVDYAKKHGHPLQCTAEPEGLRE